MTDSARSLTCMISYRYRNRISGVEKSRTGPALISLVANKRRDIALVRRLLLAPYVSTVQHLCIAYLHFIIRLV